MIFNTIRIAQSPDYEIEYISIVLNENLNEFYHSMNRITSIRITMGFFSTNYSFPIGIIDNNFFTAQYNTAVSRVAVGRNSLTFSENKITFVGNSNCSGITISGFIINEKSKTAIWSK